MDRKYTGMALVAMVVGLSSSAFAHKENFVLQYTMKALAKDVALVAEPTKKPNPGDVLDGTILTAIVRARTAEGMIQDIIAHKGGVEGGKIVLGEMTPGGLDELGVEKFGQMMTLFEQSLLPAKTKLVECEALLKTQFDQKNPELRDFRPLKAKLTEIASLESDGHKIFRPQD